jgi:hypothetical protein
MRFVRRHRYSLGLAVAGISSESALAGEFTTLLIGELHLIPRICR